MNEGRYRLLGRRVFFEKVDEAKKNYKLIKFDPLDFTYITRLEQIINLLISETDLQLFKAVLQLLLIYYTISILIYRDNTLLMRILSNLVFLTQTQLYRLSHIQNLGYAILAPFYLFVHNW